MIVVVVLVMMLMAITIVAAEDGDGNVYMMMMGMTMLLAMMVAWVLVAIKMITPRNSGNDIYSYFTVRCHGRYYFYYSLRLLIYIFF